MNVNAVRHAIAEALATPAMHVSAYAHSQPTPPGVQILPPAVTYDLTMARGHDEWVFTIQGFVSGSDLGSQRLLDELIDTQGEFSRETQTGSGEDVGGPGGGSARDGTDTGPDGGDNSGR